MKKIQGGKKQHAACPDNIDAQIYDIFKAVNEELYNSAGSEQAMNEIKEKLNSLIGQGEESLCEVNKLTGSLVMEACSRMKQRQSRCV